MKTSTTDNYLSIALRNSMVELHHSPQTLLSGYNKVTVEPGFGMLVEPINTNTYVFVSPDTVHEFDHEKGNGTDHLRQRILAGVFFAELVATHRRANPASLELVEVVSKGRVQHVTPEQSGELLAKGIAFSDYRQQRAEKDHDAAVISAIAQATTKAAAKPRFRP